MGQRSLEGHGLQGDAHRIDFVHLTRRQLGDCGAAIGNEGHQSLGLELVQRLAHRDFADLKSGSQIILAQGLVAFEPAL